MVVSPDGDVVISPARRQRWRLAAMGTAMTAACVLLIVAAGVMGLVIGIIGLLFFCPATIYLFVQAVRPGPAVILSAGGFTDHASAIGVGFVRWDEVRSVATASVMGRTFVVVRLADPADVVSRQAPWRRLMIKLNRRWWPGEVFIPDTALPMPAVELARMMRAKLPSSHR